MPNEGECDRGLSVELRDGKCFDNVENDDDAAVRRELYRTQPVERRSECTPASPTRQLPPPIIFPPSFTQNFKTFHLDLLEHLYNEEMYPRHPEGSARQESIDAPDSSIPTNSLKTEISLARKFLGDMPDLVSRRDEATRRAEIHEEAENLCVAPVPENVSRKRHKTTGHPTSNVVRRDHGGAGEQESSLDLNVSTLSVLSPSFRIVEHLLSRQAELAAKAWSRRQMASVTPLLTLVRRRIESLQGVQKHQQDQEQEAAQRLIDKLLSTNPKRTAEMDGSRPNEHCDGSTNDARAATTALKLRLWNLLRHDLESLSAHAAHE